MNDPGLHHFRYRAVGPSGDVVRGRMVAHDAGGVRRAVQRQGLALLEIRTGRGHPWAERIRTQDVAVLFRNLATLTEIGVSVDSALAASEPLVSGRLQAAVSTLRALIREGHTVSEAMGSLPGVFPRGVVGMIRAGEQGSRLGDAFESAARQLEQDAELKSELRSSLSYPALIVVVGLLSIVVIGGVVVPRFADIIGDLGGDLPAGARALLTVSSFLTVHGWSIGLTALASLVALAHWARQPTGRARVDAWLLRLPVVTDIRLGFASARVCRALGGMLGSGVTLLDALACAADAAADVEVQRRLELVRDDVRRGRTLTDALTDHRALTPLSIQLIGVGEVGGKLAEMAVRAGEVAAERTRRSLRSLVGLLEPLLIVGLGVAVAVVAGALLQAVYGIRPIS